MNCVRCTASSCSRDSQGRRCLYAQVQFLEQMYRKSNQSHASEALPGRSEVVRGVSRRESSRFAYYSPIGVSGLIVLPQLLAFLVDGSLPPCLPFPSY